MQRKINKLLAANRGEIAIRIFRAATELNINTVAIYTYEDRYSLHRFKSDEAYQIGDESEPLKSYLDIEAIIKLAKEKQVDAIHPGYGFLSENVQFAKRCREEGIIFVGPSPEAMEQLGDKIASKLVAIKANVPIIQDSQENLTTIEIAKSEAKRIGYPVMLKASAGGGGRGMRVLRSETELEKGYPEARNEAKNAFGDDTVFLEKYIDEPKHIEVQIMGDHYGNLVHLFERDCSVQRRFQKVIEIAPAYKLPEETKRKLYEYALNITRAVNYNNVGTVEFLVDKEQNIFFIEVNPRVQVEHTITEEITGIDIVRSQILIAEGKPLSDNGIYIRSQEDVKWNGSYAIQCRITTEDPTNNFKPDYGTVIAYRNAGGFRIRLDEGNLYQGVKISPFFDSMLVKICASGRTFSGASKRMVRTLKEFRLRGVKTNIGFLLNVIQHDTFLEGKVNVNFIGNNPDLLVMTKRLDRSTKVLRYLAETIVNGNPDVQKEKIIADKKFRVPKIPQLSPTPNPSPLGGGLTTSPVGRAGVGLLRELGREEFSKWLRNDTSVHFTDTTFRDAHQSLIATRMRTKDMMAVAENFAKTFPQIFSMEVWGGATFDVTMRFLKECPWERLQMFRKAMPNTLLQMLLRGSNAVGYTSYPNNLVEKFIEKSAENGIDVFRIFDSLNWLDAMKISIKTVLERTNSLAEGCICYTGEFQNNTKYSLQYYLDLARRLEDTGIHILAIKDMAGLLKPYSAEILITELRKAVSLPIHLHTHDTASVQSGTYIKAIDAGVNVVDVALASMSGLTSQPNFNSLVACLQNHPRGKNIAQTIDLQALNQYSNYFEDVREYYYPFESDLKAGTAEVYDNEIPGGQYSNLRPQAISLGLEDKFELIKKNYVVANKLFGDIIKVTPSSKVVGDLAMFMTANNLTEEDILQRGHTLSFPESVRGMLRGEIGQPHGGFPENFVKAVLKDEKPHYELTGEILPPMDFEKELAAFKENFVNPDSFPSPTDEINDFLSYKMYPKVFEEYHAARNQYGNLSNLPTPAFFYGMTQGQEIEVEIAEGKRILVRYLGSIPTDKDGLHTISFELNGQTRRIRVKDKSFKNTKAANRKAKGATEIGSPLQGRIGAIMVQKGDSIKVNQPLFVIEAMKMESTITANVAGVVEEIVLQKGAMVEQEDLVVVVR